MAGQGDQGPEVPGRCLQRGLATGRGKESHPLSSHLEKAYVGVFGSGLGHATRMLAVASRLRSTGCEVRFCSSGEVTGFIRREGFDCNSIPTVDVVYNGAGAFSAVDTARVTPMLLAKFIGQISSEVRHLLEFEPDAVLSDSVLSTVIASKLLGKRVVTVLNQLRLESSPDTPELAGRLLSAGSVTVGGGFWGLSDSILLPDLPPPFTISERTLWGAGAMSREAKYVGFLIPPPDRREDALVERLVADRRTRLFWQISGPPRTRAPFLSKAISLAALLGDEYVSVISAGNPLGNVLPRPIPGGYFYDWCPVKDRLVEVCDIVVARAGHTSLAQFIVNGKPTLLVPITGQSEQEGNATKAAKLGVSMKVSESEFNLPRLTQALEELKGDGYVRRAQALGFVARRYDAVGNIMDALAG